MYVRSEYSNWNSCQPKHQFEYHWVFLCCWMIPLGKMNLPVSWRAPDDPEPLSLWFPWVWALRASSIPKLDPIPLRKHRAVLQTSCPQSVPSRCYRRALNCSCTKRTHTTRCCGAASSVTRSALWDKILRPFLKKGGGGFYVINALAVKIVLIKMYNNLYSV